MFHHQMDATDEMTKVYEALVHWADVVAARYTDSMGTGWLALLPDGRAAKLRPEPNHHQGSCAHPNKVAGFIITGGQDNIQGVAGQLLSFFSELGFYLPQFPFVAHSRGWTAETWNRTSPKSRAAKNYGKATRALLERSVETAERCWNAAPVQRKPPAAGAKRTGSKWNARSASNSLACRRKDGFRSILLLILHSRKTVGLRLQSKDQKVPTKESPN